MKIQYFLKYMIHQHVWHISKSPAVLSSDRSLIHSGKSNNWWRAWRDAGGRKCSCFYCWGEDVQLNKTNTLKHTHCFYFYYEIFYEAIISACKSGAIIIWCFQDNEFLPVCSQIYMCVQQESHWEFSDNYRIMKHDRSIGLNHPHGFMLVFLGFFADHGLKNQPASPEWDRSSS